MGRVLGKWSFLHVRTVLACKVRKLPADILLSVKSLFLAKISLGGKCLSSSRTAWLMCGDI